MNKPKLLYFLARPQGYAVNSIEGTVDRLLRGFQEFFEVRVISEDADYDQACETHQPDITVFDCGDEAPGSRLTITNTQTHPHVPRVGIMKGDSHSCSRVRCQREIEMWGLEALFTQGDLSLKESLPAIRHMIFDYPFYINPEVFHDYGQSKTIPVLFVGRFDGRGQSYAWRQRIIHEITPHYPALVFPHPGYDKSVTPAYRITGADYARTLNSAYFAPTCGDFCRIVVKKHLEIPAAKCGLIAERTPAVEAFGFVDMENCVLADTGDVRDKLDHLFTHRDELERLIENGHRLVHSRHTFRQRPQLLQYCRLRQQRGPGQQIVQTGLFDDLKLVDTQAAPRPFLFVCGGRDREALRQGDELFARHQYRLAARHYRQGRQFRPWISEVELRLAQCHLRCGQRCEALRTILRLNDRVLRRFDSPAPDPVEWATLLTALLAAGRLADATEFAGFFPTLAHPQLDAVRVGIAVLSGQPSPPTGGPPHLTIHDSPARPLAEHLHDLAKTLRACRQWTWARRLKRAAPAPSATGPAPVQPVNRAAILHALERVSPGRGFFRENLRPVKIALRPALRTILTSLPRRLSRLSVQVGKLRVWLEG